MKWWFCMADYVSCHITICLGWDVALYPYILNVIMISLKSLVFWVIMLQCPECQRKIPLPPLGLKSKRSKKLIIVNHEDGDDMLLWNVRLFLNCTVIQPRRPYSSSSLLLESQIHHDYFFIIIIFNNVYT
jgi:hypothetical protein